MSTNESYLSTPVKIKNFFLDLIFPPTCIGCIQLINSAEYSQRVLRPSICNKCKASIVIQNSFACAFCHATVVNGITCPFCRPTHELSQLLVATSYEQPLVKSAIKNFKYQFMQGLGEDLASVMVSYLQKQTARGVVNVKNMIIVPVPLSDSRLRWRGFNQAELLAQTLGKNFEINPLLALKRTKNQKTQAEIKNREDRIANMEDAFVCISLLVKNSDILLVDDVSTTGSTLEQCARALKKAGANKITGFVFARNS